MSLATTNPQRASLDVSPHGGAQSASNAQLVSPAAIFAGQRHVGAVKRPHSLRLVLLFAILIFAACLVSLAVPSNAYARDYTCPSVEIDATVNADGSLSVAETRTFSFDGSFSAIWWSFDSLPSEESELSVSSVSVAPAEGEDAPVAPESLPADLPEAEFEREWRDAGGPAEPAYSTDEARNTVYVFYPFDDARLDVTLNYTVSNFVQVYDDVAELYWQYIGHDWSVDSERVMATVHLPVPAGAAATPGDIVRAWAHGPLDGALSLDEAGTISMTIPVVSAGGYAEVRSVFPREWLSDLSASSPAVHTGDRLESVLDDEERLSKQANAERVRSLALTVVCLVVSLAVIVWALVMFFRHGKEHKPQFKDEYWRDIPEKGVHPAVIGRLWRWDAESNTDFTATLMRLSAIGAIRLDAGSYEQKSLFGSKTVNDYYITRMPGWQEKVAGSRLDERAMAFLFEKVASGADALWFGTIEQYGSDNPEEFTEEMAAWQGVLSAETNKYDFFEAKGKRYQGIMIMLAVLGLIGGIVAAFASDNFVPLITAVPAIVVLFVISGVMSRRSKHAVELFSKCEALRRWLKDFSALDERLPTDVKVWGEMMVYAYVLGVADEAIKALRMRMPEVVDDADFLPVYYWMMPHYYGTGSAASAMNSPLDTFSSMQSNTVAVAQAAMSAASGNFSSIGGSGGGFSGGGFSGGGFGGGGGGAR